jgi:hypothetical protein
MKAKRLLMTLVLGLALTLPAAPGSLAMNERPAAAEPGLLSLAGPAQQATADPAPTADAPSEDTAIPEEIAGVPGVT